MSLINSVLKAFEKGDNVRDYAHASRTFVTNNYELQPRYQHLFHVVFNFTPPAAQMFNSVQKLEIPLLVKSVDLPKYQIDTQTHNQYNRTVHTHHKINYQPVNMTFHDDQKDLIRQVWYRYMNFYFRDSGYGLDTASYSTDDRYTSRFQTSWGLARGGPRFFSNIKIYSMFQKRFAEYTLVNPIISDFGHGSHAYESGGLMEHTMTLNYETVKYATGIVNNINPRGFGDIHYDTTPSPIGIFGRGPQNSVFFAGGIVEAANEVATDLAAGNLIGAIVKGGLILNNTRNINLKDVLTKDAQRAAGKVLRGENPFSGVVIPKIFNAQGAVSSVTDFANTHAPLSGGGDPGIISSNRSSVFSNAFNNPDAPSGVPVGNGTHTPTGDSSPAAPRRISQTQSNERIALGTTSRNTITTGLVNRASELSSQISRGSSNSAALQKEKDAIVERLRLSTGKTIDV